MAINTYMTKDGGSTQATGSSLKRNSLMYSSLISSKNRVEAPFIRVKIGNEVFGLDYPSTSKFKYPKYVKSLTVKKINGTVNTYTLVIDYPVTHEKDPNYFEKIFSSISLNRTIVISYGDAAGPEEYIFKEEEAIITGLTTTVDVKNAKLSYTVSAVSSAKLALTGVYSYSSRIGKPSEYIKKIILDNSRYHLLDVFTGMRNYSLKELTRFIDSDDISTDISTITNVSALELVSQLVQYMQDPRGNTYTLVTKDGDNGPYFEIQKVTTAKSGLDKLCTYAIDIGYPSGDMVTSFQLKNTDNWSIYYNYATSNKDANKYAVDNYGKVSIVNTAPQLSGTNYVTRPTDQTWIHNVTSFPISATMTIKGLLRPAILMTYVKLNVYFYGNKHISSGYYIITSQEDKIGENGFYSTLELTKVSGDEDVSNEYILGLADNDY